MLKRNLISIIIPVYNASAFISNTIDNLLAQEVEKELLLVNDGSTDNSLNILNDYAQKYSFVKVLNQTNQGVSSARNHAIEVAQGEFLIFVDSDDRLGNKNEAHGFEISKLYSAIQNCDMSVGTVNII